MKAMNHNRPVVFLDIDDVLCVHQTLNTREVLAALACEISTSVEATWEHIFHLAARHNLLQLHEEFFPWYVISSSWTMHLSKEQFCEVFSKTGLDFVKENLHKEWCTLRSDDSYRMSEIDAWLDLHLHPAIGAILILDDELSGQSLVGSHIEEQTVFCDESEGFLYPKLVAARKILRKQLNNTSAHR